MRSSSSAFRLHPHGCWLAASRTRLFPEITRIESLQPSRGESIRGCGSGKRAVAVSNQSQPMRRLFGPLRLWQLNQMHPTSRKNPFREREMQKG